MRQGEREVPIAFETFDARRSRNPGPHELRHFSLQPRFPYNTRPCQVIRWSRGLIGLVSEARCWNQKSNLHQNYKRRSRATINESPTFSLSASHPHLPTQAPCTPALAHTSSLGTDLTRNTRGPHFTLKTSPCLCRCLSCGGFAHDLNFKAHCEPMRACARCVCVGKGNAARLVPNGPARHGGINLAFVGESSRNLLACYFKAYSKPMRACASWVCVRNGSAAFLVACVPLCCEAMHCFGNFLLHHISVSDDRKIINLKFWDGHNS